jgi:hypothetical protein
MDEQAWPDAVEAAPTEVDRGQPAVGERGGEKRMKWA